MQDFVRVEPFQVEGESPLDQLVNVEHILNESQRESQLTHHAVGILLQLVHEGYWQVRILQDQRQDQFEEEDGRV